MVDTVQVPQAPAAGDGAAHAAAMAAKVDEAAKALDTAGGAPAPAKPERPAHIPEKFWDTEKGEVKTAELAASYAELEKKLGAGKQKEPPAAEQNEAQPPAAPAGLDLAPFEAEYAEKGGLSDEAYAKLAEKGISKELVDSYIAGRTALAERYEASVLEASGVGTRDKYSAMVEWAKTGLKPDELAAYNKAVVGTKDEAVLAVSGLYARYTAAVGSDPSLLQGGTGQGASTAFRSVAEHLAAIRDPRYKTDPAYRADVESKLARSDIY